MVPQQEVFRQSIGIPMGIDPAPQMANLYLYYYEAKFMEMLTKENYSAAKKFNYTRRFIDDLHTLNNDGHIGENNNMGRIYPQELKRGALHSCFCNWTPESSVSVCSWWHPVVWILLL